MCKDKTYFLKRFDGYNSLPLGPSDSGGEFEQWMLEEDEFSDGFVEDFDLEARHKALDKVFKKFGRKMP